MMLMLSGASKKLQLTQSAALLRTPAFGFARYFNRA